MYILCFNNEIKYMNTRAHNILETALLSCYACMHTHIHRLLVTVKESLQHVTRARADANAHVEIMAHCWGVVP
jgi:hypothetical protein